MTESYNDIVFKNTTPTTEEGSGKHDQRIRALNRAWHTRNFEIGLYWKRTLYFWGFIAIAGAGYFSKDNEEYKLLIACVGLVFSVAWYLVNKASKFWQENWECHIDLLENDIEGRLYKTVLHDGINKKKPLKSYPLSVSKINQFISVFIICVWFLLILKQIFWAGYIAHHTDMWHTIIIPLLISITSIAVVIWMYTSCETSFMKNADPFKKLKDHDYSCYERKKQKKNSQSKM